VLKAVDGLHYASLKQNGLFYVFTTRHNVSPSFALELLARLAGIFKDYCGVLNEESLRKNFVLIYELLDEILVCRALRSSPLG
jgi:AP-4 complex subunit mu-1